MDYKLITQCRACGHEIDEHKQEVFEFGMVPLAGNFCKTKEIALSAAKYPLTMVCCNHCQTTQVLHDVDDNVLYKEYNYASSTIGGLNRHFVSYASFLQQTYGENNKVTFLEVGCNDGVLLKKLPSNWNKIGVDPSDVAVTYCDQSYALYNKPFSRELVQKEKLGETCDVISGSNCLAHISQIKDVFEGVWEALKVGGHFYLEVHDLYATINGNQWDTLYHEHKIEWDIHALKNALLPIGFEFDEVTYLPLHGGLIRARFIKSKTKSNQLEKSEEKLQLLRQLKDSHTRRYDSPVVKKLMQYPKDTRVAYGAAGRAVMFLNHMSELEFDYIVDDSPVRIGKFIPTIGTPIVKSDLFHSHQYQFCLVTAWNYFSDIKANNPAHKGEWLGYFGNDQ